MSLRPSSVGAAVSSEILCIPAEEQVGFRDSAEQPQILLLLINPPGVPGRLCLFSSCLQKLLGLSAQLALPCREDARTGGGARASARRTPPFSSRGMPASREMDLGRLWGCDITQTCREQNVFWSLFRRTAFPLLAVLYLNGSCSSASFPRATDAA